MTNKDAIQVLQRTAWLGGETYGLQNRAEQVAEAIRMAITALENAKNDNLTPESAQNVQKQALKMQKSDALGAKTGETCSDTISRQAAIDAVCMEWCGVKHQDCKHQFDVKKDDYYWCDGCETALRTLPDLPSIQPETCDTCKHGYFGDERCNDCRVRFTSHYERRTDGSD